MDRVFDIADSTDWLGTALSGFMPLENALRCQVCKDFFDTPMITSCSHTFCSLCIRRCIASDGKCPTCRASDQDSKLRRNWTVQELVDAFQTARPAALELARKASIPIVVEGAGKKGVKRKLESNGVEASGDEGRPARRTRSSARKAESTTTETPEVIDLEGETDDGEAEEYQPDDGLVACPMCNKRMKEEAVFPHLDRCDGQAKEDSSHSTRSRSTATSSPLTLNPLTRAQHSRNVNKPSASRLPQLNYTLLKDNSLRKKLQELGIPSWGPRQLLIRRHTEWVNLWNANCDSMRPRLKHELLSELDSWERNQGGHATGGIMGGGSGGAGASLMRKDFDGQGWVNSNRSQFDDLIAKARMGRAKKTAEKESEQLVSSQANVEKVDNSPPNGSPIGARRPSAANPYEGNDEALAKVREKVEEANNTAPAYASGQSPPPNEMPSDPAAVLNADNAVETTQNRRSSQDVPSSLASHITSPIAHSLQKKPMFEVPTEPVIDVDSGESTAH